jgi:hypothetical protein
MKALGRAWFQHPIAVLRIGKVCILKRWYASEKSADDIGTIKKNEDSMKAPDGV